MSKRRLAMFLAGIMVFSSAFTGYSAKADAADGYVTVSELSENGTAAPAKDAVVPDANQYRYQKEELSAFCHFGPNTFNEIEWGEHYGDSHPSEIFTLTDDFDADTMVSTLKEAGFEKLIVTAKHHDGFCIWDSAYTDYDVAASGYQDANGNSDVLAEISAACTKYDMDMGLYLSPWDIHEPSYGTVDGDAYNYNEFYNNQLIEILSQEKYGNAGHFNEVWMDGAKGSGAYAQDYDFQRWFATIQQYEGKEAGYDADCMLFGAEAYTTVRWIGNESGLSNEETWSKSIANKDNNTVDHNNIGHYTAGYSNGNQWTVPEADSRITSGWFWGNNKKTPASMTELANRYFQSVGYNSTMLLNVPPNNKGTVDEAILNRTIEFGENVRETFRTNRAKDAAIKATEVRGNDAAYSPANVLDGDAATYWTVNDGTTTGSLVLDLGSVKTFDVVSIEESIEYGQRITSFQVQYSSNGTDWQTMEEGTTIGAKRLVRTVPVKAQYVKITVSTADTDVYTSTNAKAVAKGTVPMLAEVGVYKASEGFELAGAAPEGMTVIDERDSAFTFTGSWNNESGTQFPIEQTGKWCNAGPSFTVNFTGSKIYLVGTIDPNHSTANVSIDGGAVKSINTYASTRALGQIIYTSDDLEYGNHTLTLNATGTIGIDGAYVIDNGGVGMIGFENAKYNMNENEEIMVKLFRVGGSEGEARVLVSPNPGSAIQDDYDTECITEVVFADSETEKTAPVRTRKNDNQTGDQYFTIELTTETENLILGFNDKARVTIKDAEGITVAKLAELVADVQDMNPELYTADSWVLVNNTLAAAERILEEAAPEDSRVVRAYENLEDAVEALVARESYTAEDPFIFPTVVGETKKLEAEFAYELINDDATEEWKLSVSDADWASNGKFVNCLDDAGDKVFYALEAPYAGTYTVRMAYRSGSQSNSIKWTTQDDSTGVITAGNTGIDTASTSETCYKEFDIVVEQAGKINLLVEQYQNKGPQMDYFEITAKEFEKMEVAVTAGANGTVKVNGEAVTGSVEVGINESVEFVFEAEEGYVVKDVLVNGESVGAVSSYTVANPTEDVTIEVSFRVAPISADDASLDYPTSTLTAIADNEYAGSGNEGPKTHILDGNNATYWHTDWLNNKKYTNEESKRYVGVTLNVAAEVAGIRYLPRQGSASGGDANGRVTAYRAEYRTSLDGEWITCGTGTLDYTDSGWQLIEFDAPVTALEVRLVGVETYTDAGNNHHMSCAEFRVIRPREAGEVPVEPEAPTSSTYTAEDPFVLPSELNASKTLEAEHMVINNTGTNEQWPMEVKEASWASNGKFMNSMNNGDSATLYYNAPVAGTYTVTLTFRSGNSSNGFSWSEANGKITAGTITAGANDSAGASHTATMTLEVVEAGAGILTLSAASAGAPQMDKFDVVLTAVPEPSPEPTPSPEPSPEPTPSPEPSPEPTPSPEPSPEPTPSPEPSPEPTPGPDDSEHGEGDVCVDFEDVAHDAWYEEAVQYVFDNGIMTGIGGTTKFEPESQVIRAVVIETLYKLEGRPSIDEYDAPTLDDFDESDWWSDALTWAFEKGIATGNTHTNTFDGMKVVTREEVATFLHRYAEYKARTEIEVNDTILGDTEVSDWAKDGFAWVVENGIITGIETENGAELAPEAGSVRAQLAMIMMRYCELSTQE